MKHYYYPGVGTVNAILATTKAKTMSTWQTSLFEDFSNLVGTYTAQKSPAYYLTAKDSIAAIVEDSVLQSVKDDLAKLTYFTYTVIPEISNKLFQDRSYRYFTTSREIQEAADRYGPNARVCGSIPDDLGFNFPIKARRWPGAPREILMGLFEVVKDIAPEAKEQVMREYMLNNFDLKW